jgi:hypothetical protein
VKITLTGLPASSGVRVVNGLTNAPVAGVTVTTTAGVFVTDNSGGATIQLGSTSALLAFDKGGLHGPYETAVDERQSVYALWPLSAPNSSVAISEMVYGEGSSGYNTPPQVKPMIRLDGPVSFYFDPELVDNATVVNKFKAAAALLQAVIGYSVQVSSAEPIAGTAGFRVWVSPGIPAPAFTSRSTERGRIVSGWVAFSHQGAALSDYAIRHELAHVFGLWHHTGAGLVGVNYDPNHLDYSPAEKDNMRMMLRITPGTSYPYNDRTAYTVRASTGTETIYCNFDR